MLTRWDIARLLTSGLKTTFQKGYEWVPTIFQEMTTEVKSTKSSEEYGWLGENPGLKEWIDERAPKALREVWFTLKNKDYEATISVDRNALDDDQYGQITTRVNSMAIAAKKSYDVFFTEKYAVLALTFISGTSETNFKNIYFSGVGELKGDGVKTADTVSFQSNGKLANTNIIKI